ncbi:phosphatidylinositol kinase [Flavobacterium columnare]|uniref:Phosphatidylinositol kinase n=1 Tax=Flavobacterium columnare TaxID=996 RepID=A0A437UDH2_9FLAO|nr:MULTISPECIES: HipA N-terminal domain-containing protein [Flavobacterium]QYS89637.1 HipA N-terminal domain-containing protein [Flavobacterium davisii]RVU91568.1 phosphatidylinositol kinase [Flavobacterium columnare]
MRQAIVKYNNIQSGILKELDSGEYEFVYDENYIENFPDLFITFNMPVQRRAYRSKRLFPFFDGLIPEGWLLNIASESWKINKNDRMGLLLACCQNTIGAVSIHPINENQDV